MLVTEPATPSSAAVTQKTAGNVPGRKKIAGVDRICPIPLLYSGRPRFLRGRLFTSRDAMTYPTTEGALWGGRFVIRWCDRRALQDWRNGLWQGSRL